MTTRCHFLFASITMLFLAGKAAAVDTWPVKRGPSREPVPYRYDAKVWAKVPREFLEDAAACILYYGTNHIIEADGNVETITHEITRLNGRKGIENHGEYRGITFDPTWQTLVLNEARILKANGKTVDIEPRHVQLRDIGTDFQVYDKDKQLVISFPNLEVGDCFEVKWTTRGKNPQFNGKFFSRLSFGDDQNPVVRDELRVRLPKAMPFHHAVLNGKIGHAVKEDKDEKIYHWWSDKRRPLPQDADAPSKETLRLQVLVSTFASWDEVGTWKEKLRANCWTCTPEIQEQVRALTGHLKTPLEKARALTYWVRRAVRYVSISSSGHGFVPRQPQQVFSSRYGDCKDQAQLLAVMLKHAGLDVSLVTLGTLDDGQVIPEVPSPWGTHGILLVIIDGQEHWIDTTVPLAAWDFLPRADRDRTVYVTQDGKLRLLKTPKLIIADNRIVQFTQLQIMPDGTSVGRRAMNYTGLAAVNRRDAWMETPPGERRRLLTADLQDAHSRSRLLGIEVKDKELANLDQDVTARLDYTIPGHFFGDPDGSITDSPVWNRLLAYTLDPDRPVPLHLVSPFESIHRYVIQLPPSFHFESMPPDQEVTSKWGSFEIRVNKEKSNAQLLELTYHTRLEKVQVDLADFAEFQKFHDAVFKRWRVYLNPKPVRSLSAAPALEFWNNLTFGMDDISTVILADLYLDQGKYAEARRVLRTARAVFPDRAKLWEMAVRAAADLAEEEALYLEMMRRFPEEMKYQLGLGTVRVKHGDHAGAAQVLLPLTEVATSSKYFAGEAQVQLAKSAFAQDLPAKALEHLEAADSVNPSSLSEILPFKALVFERLGRLDDAIAVYREAGKDVEVLTTLIRLELAAGKTRDALTSLRRLVVHSDKDRKALLRAAEFYMQMGKYDDALDVAFQARDLGYSGQTQKILGQIHFHKGDFPQAVFHLERADNSALVRELWLRGLIAQGKLSEALRVTEASAGPADITFGLRLTETLLLHLSQRRTKLLGDLNVTGKPLASARRAVEAYVCAEHLQRIGRPAAEIEKLLNAAFNENVAIGQAYALRAQLALDKGTLRQALADAEWAIHYSPHHALGYFLRGRVRLERGDYGALGDMIRAADLTQYKDGLIVFWLAQAQHHIGQPRDALANIRLAAALRPRDAEVLEYLRKMEREMNR